MTTFNGWYIFSVVAVLLVSSPSLRGDANRGGIQVTVEPTTILPGERARLQITLTDPSLPEGDEMQPTINDKMLDLNPKIHVLDRIYRKEDGKFYWEYQFTSHKLENLKLPPLEIQAGPNTYSTESQEIKVVSERVEGDDVARPEFDELPKPFLWKKWLKIIGLATLLTACVALFVHFAEKLKRAAAPRKAVEPTEDEHPLVWLQRELTGLKVRASSGTVTAKELDELTRLLRRYYSKETRNPVDTWTSREFKQRFIADPAAQKISVLFERMDHCRFVPPQAQAFNDIFGNCIQETERALLPWTA